MTEPTFGINIDGDGFPDGLWFAAERVRIDEHAYVDMTHQELLDLAERIEVTR